MTRLLLAGLLLQAPATPPAAPDTHEAVQPPALREVDALLVENYLLRLQALQAELDRRREAIDARLREAYPGWRWDWQTNRLVRVEVAQESADKEP